MESKDNFLMKAGKEEEEESCGRSCHGCQVENCCHGCRVVIVFIVFWLSSFSEN